MQAGLDIHQVLTAQKHIDEIVSPRFEPHIDNNALADRTALMWGVAKPPTTRILRVDKSGRSCPMRPGGRLNKKDGLTRYGNSHVKDKTS